MSRHRRMMGPSVYFHPSNPHSGLHWERGDCEGEPPWCRVVPEVDPRQLWWHSDGSWCFGDPDCIREWHTETSPIQGGNPVPVDPKPEPAQPYPPRASALNEARDLITGDRNNQYGPPTQDFDRTAKLLNALGYVRLDAEGAIHDILSSDVALIIAQVKVSRLMHSRDKRDSWVDLAGYAACGYECAVEEAESGAS